MTHSMSLVQLQPNLSNIWSCYIYVLTDSIWVGILVLTMYTEVNIDEADAIRDCFVCCKLHCFQDLLFRQMTPDNEKQMPSLMSYMYSGQDNKDTAFSNVFLTEVSTVPNSQCIYYYKFSKYIFTSISIFYLRDEYLINVLYEAF